MSYRMGLIESGIDITEYDQVIICNDSVYGPLFNLGAVFKRMNQKKYKFWGITKSETPASHIQSYFIVFGKEIIDDNSLYNFFLNVESLSSKEEIIKKYEIGLSSWLRGYNHSYGAYSKSPALIRKILCFNNNINCDYHLNMKYNRYISTIRRWIRMLRNYFKKFRLIILSGNYDPTILFWKELLEDDNPFMKIRTFRKYLTEYEKIYALELIEERCDYAVSMIKKHQLRTNEKYR
jgi:lipopolysaccharide biosynthesis protein